MTHSGMSIVSVNEWDTFKNIFSQNGIGDLIRQEIKILRKLYYIEKSLRPEIQLHTKVLTKILPRLDLGDYEIFEEGEEELCNICNRTSHYDRCLKCMCEKFKYDDKDIHLENILLTDTERYKIQRKYRINHLLWAFYYELNRHYTINFNKLSYEDKMEIFSCVAHDRDIEYMEMGIYGTKYLCDIIPCEDKLNKRY